MPASAPAAPQEQGEVAPDRFGTRLAAKIGKKASGSEQVVITVLSVWGRLKAELDGFLKLRGTLSRKENPMDW